MLCVSLKPYVRPSCAPVTGGISDILLFDIDDFNFTQAAAVAGQLPGYSAAALRTGATAVGGALLYQMTFKDGEAEWKFTQSNTNSPTWAHEFDFFLEDNSQALTNALEALDSAGSCCGLGIVMRLKNGKIFVAGEKWVNANSAVKFRIKQDGTTGGSGKAVGDNNGAAVVLKGESSRNLYEYTGTWATIEALTTA